MKTNILVLIITVLTLLFSCSSKQKEKQGYENGNESNEIRIELNAPPPLYDSDNFPQTVAAEKNEFINSPSETLDAKTTGRNKKIIKDGNIAISTNDILTSKKNFDELLKTLNAYYETEDLQNNDQKISYYIKIRIPANNFEQFISSIENGKDEIKNKSIQVRDVTEEYVDIETRLTNKREYLQRYKELLSKAKSVNEILAIEEHIRTLQEEIESKAGRLKYLNDQVSLSSLVVNLFQDKDYVHKPEPKDNFSERVKTSLSRGWTTVVDFILWSITIWPFIILTLIVFFMIRGLIIKRKSRLKSKHTDELSN